MGPVELLGAVSGSALRLRAPESSSAHAINPQVDRFPEGYRMRLPEGAPSQRTLALANRCHAGFAAGTVQRRRDLQASYERLGAPDELIVMVYCDRYFPLFRNWLASCDHHGIPVRGRLLTFTLDQAARNKTAALGIETCFLDPKTYVPGGGSSNFGDREFSRTMFYKNAVVHEALSLGANVLFQDVDLVWLRDPFPYFASQDRAAQVSIMYDGANHFHAPLYANTGFFYVTCDDACEALFETALRNTTSILHCRSHQRPFNQILADFCLHNVLSVRVLPENRFLNGHLFNLVNGVSEQAKDWKDQGYVVHYSWTGNRDEKRLKVERFGFGFGPLDSS